LIRRWALLAALAAFTSACAAARPLAKRPPRAWAVALAEADSYAAAEQFARADSVLASYAAAHPTSPDTLDVLFWRALYHADPANPEEGALSEALDLIDRYLRARAPQPHLYEATALRRFAQIRDRAPIVRVDTVRAIDSAAIRVAVAREVEARQRVHDEDAQRLRDSLARTTAELERIRRRLAPPQQ
jgi:lipoprotein-anchoring transpeptidase ErfK/SrfK